MSRPLLYVAGPYTRPDPVKNTHYVVKVAEVIYDETPWVPIIPHATMMWHLVSPHRVDFWYEYDLHVLRRCQAVVRLPGASSGADDEMTFAIRNDIQVVDFTDLPVLAQLIWEQNDVQG